jgi:hypothetical protein
MDYFKIIILILLILLSYKVFFIDNKVSESFESTSTTLIDDWNAINQLAQISKKLMAGGLTIPGNLNVMGNYTGNSMNLTGSITLGNKNVGTLLDSLQAQITDTQTKITALTNTVNSNYNNTVKVGDKISFKTFNSPGLNGMPSNLFISHCSEAPCGGGTTVTASNDYNRRLFLEVLR